MGQIRAAAEVRRDGMDGVRDELDGLGEAENERRVLGTGISFSRGGSQERREREELKILVIFSRN